MDIDEILNSFGGASGGVSKKAIRAALEQREAVTPGLLQLLKDVLENIEDLLANADEATLEAPLVVMLVLAYFREVRAYPLVIRLLRLDNEDLDDLIGDALTENIPQILASVSGGDVEPIQSLIEDPNLDEWVRSAGIDALRALLVENAISPAWLSDYLRLMYDDKLEHQPSYVWVSWSSLVADMCATDLADRVRAAYGMGLVETDITTLDDFESDLARPSGDAFEKVRQGRYNYVSDPVGDLEKWGYFEPRRVPTAIEMPRERDEPIQRRTAGLKVGPNERCPCGSGKKFKKCCGRAGQ